MRGIVPVVTETMAFEDAVKQMNASHLHLVAYEIEEMATLKTVLSQNANQHIGIWIGPEGGFSYEEVLTLKKQGGISITLGKRILRTETAAIAALAQVLCLTE